MVDKVIGKPQKSSKPAFAAENPVDEIAHAVPAGADASEPTGMPTSDRHHMATASTEPA